MSASYIGSVSLGDAIPLCKSTNTTVGEALESARNTMLTQSAALAALTAICDCGDIPGIQADLSASVLANLQAQVDGCISAQAQLDAFADANAYVAGLQADLNAALALIAATPAVDLYASASVGVSAGLSASVDAQASASASIDAGLDASFAQGSSCVAGILAVSAALSRAALALASAISDYTSLDSYFQASGVTVVHSQSGTKANLPTDLGTALASSPIPSGSNVTSVLLVVDESNATTTANLEAVFDI